MADHLTLTAETSERLDQFLARRVPGLSRSQAQRLIDEGHARVDGVPRRPSWRLRAGDLVSLTLPPPREASVEAEPIPLDILYEDADVLVVNKPAGLTVHPAPGHERGTLVNALLAHCPDLAGIGGVRRPGIVHRLDKDTSGVMVVAKTQSAHEDLARQIKERAVLKVYLALVAGRLSPGEGVIDAPIGRDPVHRQRMAIVPGGRAAQTQYRVRAASADMTLVEAQIFTGRTHQIRVHFAGLGHPVVGDAVYGHRSPLIDRQCLHAWRLGLHLPGTGEWRVFVAPPPPDFLTALERAGFASAVLADLRGKS
jgi:23S rRNA pseudouridine1911/1915/1917 synthase